MSNIKGFLKIIFLAVWSGILIFSLIASKIPSLKFQKIGAFKELKAPLTGFEDSFHKILERLNLEQKVGQLFIVGFKGKEINQQLEAFIKDLHPGGLLLLERNIENKKQLKNLIQKLQKIAKEDTGIPLFIAVDQEGGEVCRIEFLDCRALSQLKNEKEAFQLGLKRGRELRELGVNLNLAPLLDKAEPGDFIFPRTSQKKIKKVGDLAKAFILGQKKGGILTAIKHFPGYGGIDFNPEIEKLPLFSEIPEVSQFGKAMEAQPEMVMAANATYLEIAQRPFPLTQKGIEFLKEKIGKEIIIISDDLSTPILKKEIGLEKTIVLAQKAGIDIFLVSGFWNSLDSPKAIRAFLSEVKQGNISQEFLNDQVAKILQIKTQLSDG